MKSNSAFNQPPAFGAPQQPLSQPPTPYLPPQGFQPSGSQPPGGGQPLPGQPPPAPSADGQVMPPTAGATLQGTNPGGSTNYFRQSPLRYSPQ